MKGYWRRWVALLVFVAVLGTTFVCLGRWQLQRLEERRERNATVVAHESSTPLDAATAFARPITDGDQWQRVTATGVFDYDHEYLAKYRHLDGRNGVEVLTPLRTQGLVVLVDRGFLETSPGATPSARPGPTGTVTVTGYVRRSEVGKANATTPVDRSVRLVNSAALAADSGLPLVDGYLQLITVEPGQDPAYLPLGTPALDEGPHLSYALQWFTFCGIAVLGLFVFIRGDLRDRRRIAARAAASSTGSDAAGSEASGTAAED